jgi:hypothetical protein
MTSIVFTSRVTIIPASWLNDVNEAVYSGTFPGGAALAVASGGTGSTTAAGARTHLGLIIGTDVQAYDLELAAIAGLNSAADTIPYFTGSGTAALAGFTAAGRALLDDADASAQRTTLGLGAIATQNSNNVTITGGSITGVTDITVADGGTGVSSLTAYAPVFGGTTSTSAVQSGALGSSGQILTSNGAGALPTFQPNAGGSDFTGDSGSGGTHGLVIAPAAGDAGKFLRGDATWASVAGAGDMILAAVQTVTGAKTFGTIGGAVDKFVLAGSTSGSTVVNAAAAAGSGTMTLPTGTDTLAGLGTAQTWTGVQQFGTVGGAVGKLTLAGSTSGSTIVNAAAIAGSTTLTLQGTTGTLYSTGGTDVTVSDGGTGLSSTTAYAVLCGGTTSTAALQSIASVGTSGQVLTSNGAAALPSWQSSSGGINAGTTWLIATNQFI